VKWLAADTLQLSVDSRATMTTQRSSADGVTVVVTRRYSAGMGSVTLSGEALVREILLDPSQRRDHERPS